MNPFRVRAAGVCVLLLVVSLFLPARPTAAAGTITAVESGTFHTCVIKSGQVWCWGENSSNQLGDGTGLSRQYPVQTLRDDGTPLSGVTRISAGYDHTCAIASRQVWCWGNNVVGKLGNGTTSIGNSRAVRARKNPAAGGGYINDATDVATGNQHTCAVHSSQVWCWGSNRNNQIGAGSTPNEDGAYRVTMLGGGYLPAVSTIGSANIHTCATTVANGNVWCWGSNYWWNLGDGSAIDRNRAVRVVVSGTRTALTGMTNVSAGEDNTCATNRAGNMWCWGNNLLGQLSTLDLTPAKYGAVRSKFGNRTLISGMTYIDLGSEHGCGVWKGYATCWGYNSEGQLGIDSTTLTTAPVAALYESADGRVRQLTGITSISGGFRHTCAVKNQAEVWCWGLNRNYQLGEGTINNRYTAYRVKKVGGGFFP